MVKEISASEAARQLGLRLDSLYKLLWAGVIESRKQDGKWLISVSAVEKRVRAKGLRHGKARS